MSRKPDRLREAYSLKTPEDNRRLYADWAASYDAEFAGATGYGLPGAVAAAFAAAGGGGPVLDLGAGTGLVGERLALFGIGPMDGIDISPEMLAVAAGKGCYRRLLEGDALAGLALPEAAYAGVVSAGTFTLGHLGPEVLPELLRIARTGAQFALSVNAVHFEAAGFGPALAALPLAGLALAEVPIYEDAGDADRALIATFRKG